MKLGFNRVHRSLTSAERDFGKDLLRKKMCPRKEDGYREVEELVSKIIETSEFVILPVI